MAEVFYGNPFPKEAEAAREIHFVSHKRSRRLQTTFQDLTSLTGKKRSVLSLVTYLAGISCGDANPCHKTLRRFRPCGDPMNTLSTFI